MRASQLFPALLLASTGLLVKGDIGVSSVHAANAPTATNLVEYVAGHPTAGKTGSQSNLVLYGRFLEASVSGLNPSETDEEPLQKRDKKKSTASSAKKGAGKKKASSSSNSNSSKKKHQTQNSSKQGDAGKHTNAGKGGEKGKSEPKMSLKTLQKKVLAAEKKIKIKSCSASKKTSKGKKHARDFEVVKSIARRSSPQPGGSPAESGYDSQGEVKQGYTKRAGPGEALVTTPMLPCLGVAAIAGDGSKIVSHIQPGAVEAEFPKFSQALEALRKEISQEMNELDQQIDREQNEQRKQELKTRLAALTKPIKFAISLPTPTDAKSYTSDPQLRLQYQAGTEKDIRDLKALTNHYSPQVIDREAARQNGHGEWEAQAAQLGWDENGELEDCTEWIPPEELGLGSNGGGSPMDTS